MPPPPRRRTTSIRRPRVAGLSTGSRADAGPGTPTAAVDTGARAAEPATAPPEPGPTAPAAPTLPAVLAEPTNVAEPTTAGRPEPAELEPPDPAPAGPESRAAPPTGVPATGRQAPGVRARLASVPVLAAAIVLFAAAAVAFALLDQGVRGTPVARNTALVDIGATAEVSGQLGDALETLYSFDFARLDENERAIREVITPGFGPQFDVIWDDVEQLAPQLQAVVSATVNVSAVKLVDGDRAELVAFVDQQATRVAEGGESQLASAGRITVVGERVDGRWKIADIRIH